MDIALGFGSTALRRFYEYHSTWRFRRTNIIIDFSFSGSRKSGEAASFSVYRSNNSSIASLPKWFISNPSKVALRYVARAFALAKACFPGLLSISILSILKL